MSARCSGVSTAHQEQGVSHLVYCLCLLWQDGRVADVSLVVCRAIRTAACTVQRRYSSRPLASSSLGHGLHHQLSRRPSSLNCHRRCQRSRLYLGSRHCQGVPLCPMGTYSRCLALPCLTLNNVICTIPNNSHCITLLDVSACCACQIVLLRHSPLCDLSTGSNHFNNI